MRERIHLQWTGAQWFDHPEIQLLTILSDTMVT